MPTTPGVIWLTTPATLVTAAPPISGIGAPARTGATAPAAATSPAAKTNAAKTRFIVVKIPEAPARTLWRTPHKAIGFAA
jgi:hypothetical protein